MENPEQKGIIIVGGETGSGKSSTLASMIGHIAQRPDKHIVTIEDPIEFVFRDTKALVHQREMGVDFPNYGEALRAVLREDPNVIMISSRNGTSCINIPSYGDGGLDIQPGA
jgi:twitching motility protein PilT